MTEHQDIQSLLRFEELQSVLPFIQNDREDLLSMIPFEDKDHFEALHSWLKSFLFFENMASKALTKEDRRSAEEKKQLFFKKIGFDEDSLKKIIKHGIDFFLRIFHSSTAEELESIEEERNDFLKDNENYTTALDKYILGKNRNPLHLPPVTSIC